MSYVITKQPDGDVNLGNLNGEFVSLSDSISDYATGGYAIIGGVGAAIIWVSRRGRWPLKG